MLALCPETKNGTNHPVVLIPNPVLSGSMPFAGPAVGAEIVHVPATLRPGFCRFRASLPEDILARTAICLYLHAVHPQGAVGGATAYLGTLLSLPRPMILGLRR